MDYQNYISSDYKVMLGKAVITNTRITVEFILRKIAEGATTTDLLSAYPVLTEAAIKAVLLYAADIVSNEELITVAA